MASRMTFFSVLSCLIRFGHGNVTPVMEKIHLGSKGFQFKTCANSGRYGPTQYQCDRTYDFTDINVTVLNESPFAGVQVWTVPKTALYSITALGAGGGKGVGNSEVSKGGYVSGKFNLTEGEQIYMLIGQRGRSACEETNEATKPLCLHGLQSNKNHDWAGGGGGGGGATFVFKLDPDSQDPVPLVVAGGGGGQGLRKPSNPINSDGGLLNGGDGQTAHTPKYGAGGGGGWYGDGKHPQSGLSLLDGGLGGAPCQAAVNSLGWQTNGGFGGGGGGCNSGGGGGGYTGGNVSTSDDPEQSGMGGSSFISPEADSALFEQGIQEGDGEVEIAYIFDCQCDFLCIYFDEESKQCYCPPNYILADDGKTCLNAEKVKKIPKNKMITITVGSVVGVITVSLLILLIVLFRNKCRLKAVRLKHLNNADYQLNHLRNVTMPRSMEYNPNYDFGGTKCTLQDLREIPRQHLLLIRALGQGAFGEVYQGYLSNLPPEATDMPVAVKTLPALSTDQAEMDFLMEALIMSKFDHPNIVKFVGVCFEKHPRFIILELLEGGDLKNFLRECRPKQTQPSPLTMLDLVHLSLDVAKGCQYLEENHFIHRDIAARNCLLTTKRPGRVAKIADFGMARDIYRADYYRKGGKAMLPVKWMPPEAFMDGIFTSKTDVWSFGILLWEVFSLGYMPYPGRGNHEVMQLVTAGGRLDPPQNCPPAVYDLMRECWNAAPEHRPDFNYIIEKLQDILTEDNLISAPLPAFQNLESMERDIGVLRPSFPDTMDTGSKCLESSPSNSLDDLFRPLDMDYKHSGRLQQTPASYGNPVKYTDPLLQAAPQRQRHSSAAAGGAVPKSRKTWTSVDAKGGGESTSLLEAHPDVVVVDAKSTAPADFSDSTDSGKSSIDSRKSRNRVSGGPDPRRSSSDLSASSPAPGADYSAAGACDGCRCGGAGDPHACLDAACPPSGSVPSGRVYENVLPPLGRGHPTRDSGHSAPRRRPSDRGAFHRRPVDIKTLEQGDSGIEVDLRSASKSQ